MRFNTLNVGLSDNDMNRFKENDIIYWELIAVPGINFPVDRKIIENILTDAFNVWAMYINLTFIHGYKNNDDIHNVEISFRKYNHKCLTSFDGKGGVLAHATFPYPKKYSKNMYIHFDASENWLFDSSITFQNYFSTDPTFFNAAVHEIGHVLGLRHTTNDGSVMTKYHERMFSKPFIPEITTLQKKYGVKKGSVLPKEPDTITIFFKTYYREITIGLIILVFTSLLFTFVHTYSKRVYNRRVSQTNNPIKWI